MNAFVFFAIFHSSDSYESPFLDQILQRIRSEKEKLLHQLQSTSLFLKCEDIRWQGSKHISWYHAIRDLKPEVHWLQPWWGGLVSSTLLKPMSTSAIVPVSCHKNYVTKYIYRCFFSNICIWPYLPWPIYFLSKKTRHLPTGGTPGANPWARNNHLSIGSGVPYQGPLSLFSHQLVPGRWHIDVTPEVSRGIDFVQKSRNWTNHLILRISPWYMISYIHKMRCLISSKDFEAEASLKVLIDGSMYSQRNPKLFVLLECFILWWFPRFTQFFQQNRPHSIRVFTFQDGKSFKRHAHANCFEFFKIEFHHHNDQGLVMRLLKLDESPPS